MLQLNFFRFLIVFISAFLLNSCISTKNWKPDQYLLVKQNFTGYKHVSYYDLYGKLRQKPNRNILIALPYLWLYNVGRKFHSPEKAKANLQKAELHYDSLIHSYSADLKKVNRLKDKKEKVIARKTSRVKEGNWLMRVVGEPPVFFDANDAEKARQNLEKFMQTKGYFQAKVEIERINNERKKRTKINYKITENLPTVWDTIVYYSKDTALLNVINQYESKKLLKENTNYDQSLILSEQARIERLMRNNGYFTFSRQYIVFEVDTILPMREADKKPAELRVVINTPNNAIYHKKFYVDDVFFHTMGTHENKFTERDTTPFAFRDNPHTVKYVHQGKNLYFSPKVLNTRVKTQTKEPYSLDKTLETQRALINLDMFKFINLNFDTTGRKFIMNIFTNPLEKTQISIESGINVGQAAVPGPFANLSLKNRNVFRGCEIIENNFQFSIDGQAGFSQNNQFYNSQEFSFNSAIIFPQLIFPTALRFKFNNYNPKTRVSLGVNFVQRPEYSRTSLRGSIAYSGTKNFNTYNLVLSEIGVINTTRISATFQQQLDSLTALGSPIQQSFARALVSSSYIIYTFNNASKEGIRNPKYLRVLLELGGNMYNFLGKQFLENNPTILDLRYFQFWRINLTYNYQRKLIENQSLAFRVNIGMARYYGISSTLPYEKFFFSGGGNSLRAWRPRRVGPGSFSKVNADGTLNYDFEQPGEILLEANIEYRFPLISFIAGALFLDAGNVWTVQSEAERPGGDFQPSRFYKEIAIGTGFGVRFDFSFLVFRLDFGIKLYDPARPEGERFVLPKYDITRPFYQDQTLINIGIGYPF